MKLPTICFSLGFSVIVTTTGFAVKTLAEPISPGNVIVIPSVCVNTTGGSCESGTIVIDDGTCKRNVVVQAVTSTATGRGRTNVQQTQVVSVGGCLPDGVSSTATVIPNPTVSATTTPPVAPTPPKPPTPPRF